MHVDFEALMNMDSDKILFYID